MKTCSVDGCEEHAKAKGLCHKHYQAKWYSGDVMGKLSKKCDYPDCHTKVKSNIKFCCKCSEKIAIREKHGLPITHDNCKAYGGCKGDKNPRWNGGNSEYNNHYLIKKNRIIKIKQTSGKCEICGKDGKHVHHIDGSKTNHNLDNLIFLCGKCHKRVHPSKTSKFFYIYGYTCIELSAILNCSISKICRLHKTGKLKEFL